VEPVAYGPRSDQPLAVNTVRTTDYAEAVKIIEHSPVRGWCSSQGIASTRSAIRGTAVAARPHNRAAGAGLTAEIVGSVT
jgi:hypothetical protein